MNLFINYLFEKPEYFFYVVLAVGFSVCVHEYCHARVALALGDPTAAQLGHLTLNPLKQMGWFSIVMLLILGICWGAVPVNPHLVSPRRRALIALAGPLSNLGLFVFSLLLFAGALAFHLPLALSFILILGMMNLVLFFINILPIPGFDGGAVLLAFFPVARWRDNELVKGIMIGMVILLFTCIQYIFAAAYWVMGGCIHFIQKLV